MKNSSHMQMFASFRLGQTELAVSISSLQEVVNYPEKITLVPLAPDYLTGLFNLRGTVTPIVDIGRLLDVETSGNNSVKKVAIVHVNSVRIGLLFDSTSEILNVQAGDVSRFENPLEGRKSVIRSILKLNGGDRIVEVLDPEALVKIENIPQILEQSRSTETEMTRKASKREQCITVHSGALEFGLSISGIREIIRVPEIKRSVLAVDYCIGMVNLRGTIIPILDFRMFLKIEGEECKDLESRRIVILKLQNIQVGFLVDSVDSIVTFFEEEVLPIPMFAQEKVEMMRGLLAQENKANVVLLNESKILSDQEILAITRGHDSLYGNREKEAEAAKARTERKPYISFRLDFMLSTRLSSIDEIAKVEGELMRPPGYPEYVVGMMKMRGEVVTIVDLRTFYGMKPTTDPANSRVLIVKGQQSKFGLLVDSVESIDTVDEANKTRIPTILAPEATKTLQGHMKEIVEVTDLAGVKKTFMILDVPELMNRLDVRAA
ncbi:chemotaxis protein CheW [Bdellovibrio bacteriovorus]|uniref:chemotaxis protein CheW n=1 Tax=Bdellovibrio bacteriovorus TaxID=959 RepID=UPI003AA809AE